MKLANKTKAELIKIIENLEKEVDQLRMQIFQLKEDEQFYEGNDF